MKSDRSKPCGSVKSVLSKADCELDSVRLRISTTKDPSDMYPMPPIWMSNKITICPKRV